MENIASNPSLAENLKNKSKYRKRYNRKPKSSKNEKLNIKEDNTSKLFYSSSQSTKKPKELQRNKHKTVIRDKFDPASLILRKQREDEIKQCMQQLGSNNFKMFSENKYVTSYGITIRNIQKFENLSTIKFVIDIPFDFPNSPIKLKSIGQNGLETNNEINNIIKNFNYKSVGFLKLKYPIMGQINYLIQERETLMMDNFKLIHKQKVDFYSQFV